MYWSNSSSSEEQLLDSEIGSSVHRVTGSSEEQLPASSCWLLEEQLLASSSWLLEKTESTSVSRSEQLTASPLAARSPAGVTVLQRPPLLAISAFRKCCQADWKSWRR